MRILLWILCLLAALSSGGPKKTETDEELRNRVQTHLDTIVDEGAAILDDVADSIRGDERVQETKEFVRDVIDITGETVEKLDGVLDEARAEAEERLSPTGNGEESENP